MPFTSVKVTDNFWGQRLKASREVTIPLAFSKCEETGRYENFVKAAHPSLTLIPYYAWAHRSESDMEVWLPVDVSAASVTPQDTEKWEENEFFKN